MNIPYEELDEAELNNLLKQYRSNLGRLVNQMAGSGPLSSSTTVMNEIQRTKEEIDKIRAELTMRNHYAISEKVAVQTASNRPNKPGHDTPHPLPSFKTLSRIFLALLVLVILGVGGFLLLTREEPGAHVSFKGAIINSADNKPVSGAIVNVTVGTSTPITAISDDAGLYSFKLESVSESAQARILVNKEGFSPYDQPVPLTANQPELERIQLEPQAQPLGFPVTGSRSAVDHPIDLQPHANESIQQGLPTFPTGNQIFGDKQVGFRIPEDKNRIDSHCKNYSSRPMSVTLKTPQLTDVSDVYVLINAGFTTEQQPEYIGDITLIFADGDSVKTPLFLGTNIREWRVGAQIANTQVVTTASSKDIQKNVYTDLTNNGDQGAVDLLTIPINGDHSDKVLTEIQLEDITQTRFGDADPCFMIAGITVRTNK